MEKKTLDQLVAGDPVLVKGPNARAWERETVTRRTRTQIIAGSYTYTYRGAFHGGVATGPGPSSFDRRYLRPFDQGVLDEQEASAAREAARVARRDRINTLVNRLTVAMHKHGADDSTIDTLQACVDGLVAGLEARAKDEEEQG
jgi:hypothetical protein